ncbi:uncharacterized protein LOC121741390 [Salvia splendens]|uniref:uncharacterized protein LOC121741390 n=1 Tax=Salvia splendens TaxID=180675 RepID=UPI001C270CFF|nr:uncharacterized protein LOC121741390 [Salvia splendens]
MKIAKSAPEVVLCEPPEIFNVDYFFNKGLLYMHAKEVCFYEVSRVELQVKQEPDVVESQTTVEVEAMRKEVAEMRTGVREEMAALRGSVNELVGMSSAHSGQMKEAVQLMMMMTKWIKENFSEPQAKLTTRPSKVSTQPGPGNSTPQHPPPASKPLLAPSASKTLTVKRTLTKQPSEEVKEKPDSPARKKAKVTRPYVPHQSGSRGGQTLN